MLEVMYVRCTHCGYDNSPEYRFCGMCGATLSYTKIQAKPPLRDAHHPQTPASSEQQSDRAAPTEVLKTPPAAESFSFQEQEPQKEFYLYEDEAPSHAGLIAILLIVVLGIGGATYWQWSHHGFPFNNGSSAPAVQNSASAPAAEAPAQVPDNGTNADSQSPAPSESAKNNNGADAAKDQTVPEAAANDASKNAIPAAASEEHKSGGMTQAKLEEKANDNPPAAKKPGKKLVHEAAKNAAVPAAAVPSVPKGAVDADSEVAGEHYLYGTGVPQDCGKAEKNLRTAAAHGNSKAQAVLGTMYYTGHCVARDLPTAYRWFARALHQDPQNSTLSADLQVLWRQMSPEERQLATTNAE